MGDLKDFAEAVDKVKTIIDKYSRRDELGKEVGSERPFSLLIECPNPQEAGKFKGTTLSVKATAAELIHFVESGVHIPNHVYDCLRECLRFGAYRVEILDGDTWYKVYCKPPQE